MKMNTSIEEKANEWINSELQGILNFIEEEKRSFEAHKKCRRCEEDSPVSNFYGCKNTKDGLLSYCKTCYKELNKISYKIKPEYYREATKKRHNLNKDTNGRNIYVIKNLFNEVYVGSCIGSIEERYNRHLAAVRVSVKNEEYLTPIKHSLHTYGEQNHKLTLYRALGNVTKKEAEGIETMLIHKFQKNGITVLNVRKTIKYDE